MQRPDQPTARIWAAALCAALILAGCGRRTVSAARDPAAGNPFKVVRVEQGKLRRVVRSTGTVQAIHAFTIPVPQVSGQGGDMTVIKLVPSGRQVKAGDVLAEFDRTKQVDAARDAQAKYDDLRHQLEQRKAQHRSEAEKRAADLQQAQADLAKAELELRKGPILSAIDRLKNEAKLEDAQAHVASLKRSSHFRDIAEAADLKILELQRDRQKVALDRAQTNSERLLLRAPLAGMVARENVWRNNSFGQAQEGDQLWPGQPLLRIFDPSQMEVLVSIGEPDGALLGPDSRAVVRVDAYPDLIFKAHFDSASPVASALLDSTVKSFPARFRLEETDPHLLPDLSAAVDVELSSDRHGLIVPRSAVHYRQGKAYVTRVTGPGQQEERPVELGGSDAALVEITSGLRAGDEILAPAGEEAAMARK